MVWGYRVEERALVDYIRPSKVYISKFTVDITK